MVESGEDLDVLYAEQHKESTGFAGHVGAFIRRVLGIQPRVAKTYVEDSAAPAAPAAPTAPAAPENTPYTVPPLQGLNTHEDWKAPSGSGGAVGDPVASAPTVHPSASNEQGFEIDDDTAARWLKHPYVIEARKPRWGIMRHITPKEIRFLWRMYRAKFWYWEMIETMRRLLLTAVVSVVSAGNGGQIVFAVFISVVSLKLYGTVNPMISREDSALLELAQYQVFLTLFISLMVRPSAAAGYVVPAHA